MKRCENPNALRGCIYLRLSKDDDSCGESASISNQRKLLIRYAEEHHFTIEREYCDDGYSGTTFDRPGLRQMIAAVEKQEINLILTKDLSRLGRDYIQTGQYTELFFPSHGVRFIAVGDGYDSAYSSTDMIPFRNVVNEMYARDISRKIRSSLKVRMDEGAFIGNFAPYGYIKSPENRHVLIPDPPAALIVKRLFEVTAAGRLPSDAAQDLNGEHVLPPALYRCQNHPKLQPEAYTRHGLWTANTIIKILHNPVYLGHMVQGKTKKISFKSPLTISVPLSERISVADTHSPLVTEQLFKKCQMQLNKRASRKNSASQSSDCRKQPSWQ